MVSKLQLTSELLDIASRDISQSYDRWTDYLTSAARMYKYPFKDQVLIYAQRPDATACMELEMWNDRMRRWITAGSKGIALIDESGQKPHLRYVYDVSDTREGIRARKVNIWQMRQEHYGAVIKSLEKIYGQTTDKMKAAHDLTFATQLMEIADRAVEDSDNDYFRVLMEVKQDSHLDYLQAKEIRDILRKTIIASVQYVLLSRCGLDAGKYLSADNFREVPSFNTAATLSCLGRSVTDISCTLLREVERSVKKYDKEKAAKTLAKTDDLSYTEFSDLKRERSGENGRVDIQPERGLLGSESGIGRYDGGHREIRESAQDLPERKQQHTLRRDVTDGQVVAASSGDKPDGTGANRQDATTDDGERGSNRSPESVQSNGMGALGEQSARFSGGNRVDGVGIQLDLFPSVQEQIEQIAFAEGEKSSAFSMSAEDINSVLLKGSDKSQGKFRIYEHFQSRPTVKESIKYLKNEYGTGGNTHIFPDGSKGYVNRDRRGIGITKDRIEIMNPDKPLSWATVENQIRDLILSGRYLASEELEKYNQWQKERQAAIMEALKTGFERPAAILQIPKKKDGDFEQLTFGSFAAATTSPPKAVDLPLGEQTAQESGNVKSVDEIFEAHYPVVINRVLSDTAYQNACKYSDKQNAGIQLEKTISHILITFIPGNLDFYRMYMDVPGIKQRLYDLVFQETYPALSGMTEDAQDHGEQDVQRPPDNARKTSGAVSSDQNAEDAPPPATLPQEQVTVDYLINYAIPKTADNEFVDSYGVAGKVFSELKDTGRNPLTWFDSEYASSYTPQQAEQIRGLIHTALQNTYPVTIPVPITSVEWERVGKGYKKSEYRDGGKAIMLAIRSGLEMMPAVIDDDNGLEIQRFAFKAGGRNEVVSAYTEKHALEVIESYGFYLDEISELKGYPLWPITSREWDGIGSDYRTEEPDGTRFILKDGTLQPIIIDDERGHELQKFTYDESGIAYICLAYTEQEALSIIETNGHNIRLVENLRSESARTKPPVQEKQAASRSESPAYQFEIRPDVDTRDSSPMFVAKVISRLSKSDFQVLKKDMGKIDGHYSRFKHGFIFRGSDPTEKINRHFNLAGSIDAKNSTQNAEASQETEKQQHIGEKQRSNIDGTFTGELTEYDSIQSKYPGAIIALQDGNTYKFYGDNAKSVRLILDRKIISRTMPDGSIINMTGFPVERESELRNLLEQSGNRAVIAAKDAPEATYYIKHEINITIDAEVDNSVTGQTDENNISSHQQTVQDASTEYEYVVGHKVYLDNQPFYIRIIDDGYRISLDSADKSNLVSKQSLGIKDFENQLRNDPRNDYLIKAQKAKLFPEPPQSENDSIDGKAHKQPIPDVIPTADSAGSRSRPEPDARKDGNSVTILPEQEDAQGRLADRGNTESVQTGTGIQNESSAVLSEMKGGLHTPHVNTAVDSVRGRSRPEPDAGINSAEDTITHTSTNRHRQLNAAESELNASREAPILRSEIQAVDTQTEIPMLIRHNYHITDNELGVGAKKVKYTANVAAIRKLQEIEAENRLATPEEQEILSRYVGWGGIPQVFDPDNDKWTKEYAVLKSLLSDEEYESARASTLNAHYTSPTVIKAMYNALERIGFKTGNILEPACGVGNFFGLVPESMTKSKLYGVELDSITGRLAKQLYQEANITVSGFEDTNFPDNFFDLAVGNVPFGEYRLSDKRYDKQNFLIHDYFFAKALDKVRPGGIVAFISSKGTLDKQNPAVRKYIADRADLLGAVRLPNNAFKQNAGTEVTTDILFFQKRDRILETEPEWVNIGTTENGIPINNYYLEHPEMVLGTMAWDSSMYGNETETACMPVPDADLSQQLAEAIQNIRLPDMDALEADELLNEVEAPDAPANESIPADPNVRNYSYTLVDGKLYYRENSNMNFVDAGKKPAERIRGMIELRDCTRALIEMQLNDADSAEIEAEQARLSTLYDQFRKKHGLINSDGNKNAFKQDSSYPLLCSLEVLDENRNFERKADMFTKRTIQRHRAVTSVDTASEALAVSIGERACVDLGYMASLMGGSEKIPDVVRDLQGVIFKDPETGPFDFESNTWYTGWQAADEYLSGDVRKKLESARKAAETYPEFAVNVEALEKIQPKDLTASEIDVQIGATWIAPEYYRQFMFETFQTPEHIRGKFIDVLYSPFTGEWNIKGKSADSSDNVRVYSKFGIKRRNAYQIFEDCLNLRDSMVYDKKVVDGKEKRVLNGDLTTVAQEKQEAMKEAFKLWLWKDPERRAVLCEKYNKTYNATRPREYDGSHINFVGMNPEKKLRPHQLNAVAHMMYGKNTLLAHCVGAGKTYEMVAAAMESKRLGLCKKSLIVVPNHLTGQWGSEFLQLYPGAKVLVARKQDFEPQNRKKFCARIATGDYDAVIIGHTQFEKIPLSAERQKETIREQINEIIDGIREAKSQNSERYTIKQMEKSKKTLEARLRRLNDVSRKDDVVTFEELGVDRLFVDEAHYYKNLFTYTKMRNVAGIGQSEAQKSSDMLAKCRYIDELTGGRGVTFATGTPISNSMVELYTMMRYLQYDTLQEKGYKHFDSWAAAYGQKVTAIELNPEGTGFRAKTRFARFVNLPELMSLWKEAADIQTADMLDLPVPEAEYITVKAKPSDHQKAMVKQLSKRANAVRKRKVKPHVDNMLTITNDGRKLALDQRLYDDLLPDDPQSKLNLCVQNIFDEWRDTTDIKGTQLVFCDLSTPKPEKAEKEKDSEEPEEAEKTGETEQDEEADEANTGEYVDDSESINFSVYQDIKNKLMAQGIPANEIAFIHDAKTDTQKTELFAKVRNGQVRVLIGSTQKMGAGTNVQDKMTALHHLDCPWRPSDLEQREGRILRQGNDNKKVKIFRYVTEGTFDAYSWGIVENKRKYIGQVVTSKSPARSVEDVDATALSYAEVKALATGDPRIKEKMDLDIQVSKLKMLKANHDGQRYELQDKLIKYFPREIKKVEAYIAGLEADDKILAAHPAKDNDFSMKVLEQTYTERKEAGAAIIRACTELMTDPDATVNIGEYRGFPMKLSVDFIKKSFILKLKQNLSYSVELGMDEIGNVARISNELSKIQSDLKYYSNRLDNLNTQMENAREEAEQPFPQEQEFAEKSARLSLLNTELSKENHDDLDEPEEVTETDDKKESVLKMLKKYGASIPAPSGMADRERDEAI